MNDTQTPPGNAAAIADFYDRHTESLVRLAGDVIQSLRTTDVSRLLDIEAASMGLAAGMRVLDAGCGVGGPAIHFACHYGVTVDAVTISGVQAKLARQRVERADICDMITVHHGDFHEMHTFLPQASYDIVCFLESFGHSRAKRAALSSAWAMLKPGGVLYIKDLFVKEPALEVHRSVIAQNVRDIDTAYCYETADLYDVLRMVRGLGYILCAVKTVDIPLEEFENLSAAGEYGALTGIQRIDDFATYIFPVDYFELVCRKPLHPLDKGANRYFLQNLYELQVRGTPLSQL